MRDILPRSVVARCGGLIFGHECYFLCRMFCFMQLHRWDAPGGHCECCGECDELFGPHDEKEAPPCE